MKKRNWYWIRECMADLAERRRSESEERTRDIGRTIKGVVIRDRR
jgi:hypothetical protein